MCLNRQNLQVLQAFDFCIILQDIQILKAKIYFRWNLKLLFSYPKNNNSIVMSIIGHITRLPILTCQSSSGIATILMATFFQVLGHA